MVIDLISGVIKPQKLTIPTPPARKRQFEQLNPILNANKKAKTIDGITSTRYSYVTWPNIREIYESIMQPMNIEPKEIPLTDLKELHNYLCKVTCKFGTITTGKGSETTISYLRNSYLRK